MQCLASKILLLHSKSPGEAHQGWAWLTLALALALHITDEALHDFLTGYNATVLAMREKIAFLPLPTFSFEVWLSGLIFAVLLLLLLSPFAFSRARWLTRLSYPLGILMLANGLQHLVGSLYFGKLLPGAYSSPLLIAASIYLLWAIRQPNRNQRNIALNKD
ncbi:MAG: hypothetical protein AB1757_16235 [Acidobacteriota bacterium]